MLLTELVYCVTVTFTKLLNLKKKIILVLGITRSLREPNLSCRSADGPRGCYDLPKKKACMRNVEWAGALMQIR